MLHARTALASASQQCSQPRLGIVADIGEHAAGEAGSHEIGEFHARDEIHFSMLMEELGVT
jgi:hypothetical protein